VQKITVGCGIESLLVLVFVITATTPECRTSHFFQAAMRDALFAFFNDREP
jgi:hypothetical protein